MNGDFKLKKFETDKVALLGLFILALLAAYVLISVKSALIFSEPVELAHLGISVSMPSGNGWHTDKQWRYGKNTYTLSSNFAVSSDKPIAIAYCQYQLAPEDIPAKIWYEQIAVEVEGKIIEMNQEQVSGLTIDWAHIERDDLFLSIFAGTAELPNDRRVNIEVRQFTNDVDCAEDVFRQIIESLAFEDNRRIKNGIEVVNSIKDKGIESFLDNRSRQSYFLIKNSQDRKIGFMIDVLTDFGDDALFNIHAAGHLYGRGIREQATLFRGTSNLGEFIWQSETNGTMGINNLEIVLDKDGIMTVGEVKRRTKTRYRLNSAAIPDIFMEQLINQFIESGSEQVIVDVIDADGKITPTVIFVVEDKDNFSDGEDTAYVVQLEFLDGKGYSERIFLNDQGHINKVKIQQNKIFIIEKTSREILLQEFPERADFIVQMYQTDRITTDGKSAS
jgi:hypothetical protein